MRSFAEDLAAARSHAQAQSPPSRVRKRRTPRQRTPIETTDYAAMMRRMLRAYTARVADSDMPDLADMLEVQAAFDEAVGEAVRNHRARHGTSWATIGDAAGIARSTACERWGARRHDPLSPPASATGRAAPRPPQAPRGDA